MPRRLCLIKTQMKSSLPQKPTHPTNPAQPYVPYTRCRLVKEELNMNEYKHLYCFRCHAGQTHEKVGDKWRCLNCGMRRDDEFPEDGPEPETSSHTKKEAL